MTRPPTAVLVLLSCIIPMIPWPRFTVVRGSWVGQTGSQFADRMALFNHVLLNDDAWSPVLEHRVKLSVLNLPRYREMPANEKFLDQMQLVGKDEDQNPPVMKVLQKLMDKTPWSGTNVNYTAYVLSTAFTCFTYNNVSFMLSLVVNRVGVLARKIREPVENNDDNQDKKKDDENNDDNNELDNVDKALRNVRMTLALMVDKVAAVEGELASFAVGLHDYDWAEETKDDLVLLRNLEMIKEKVDSKLEQHCHFTPHTEIYRYLGKYESLNDSPPSIDELVPDDDTLNHELDEFKKIIDCMMKVYDGLDVETLPMKSWLRILDYRFPISINIKFNDLK